MASKLNCSQVMKPVCQKPLSLIKEANPHSKIKIRILCLTNDFSQCKWKECIIPLQLIAIFQKCFLILITNDFFLHKCSKTNSSKLATGNILCPKTRHNFLLLLISLPQFTELENCF